MDGMQLQFLHALYLSNTALKVSIKRAAACVLGLTWVCVVFIQQIPVLRENIDLVQVVEGKRGHVPDQALHANIRKNTHI